MTQDNTAVLEAVVLATNTSNGERWRTVTRANGRYFLEPLSIGGPYRVEVTAVGFRPARQDVATLSLGQRLTANFELRPLAFELEPITVHPEVDPLINSGRTGPAQSIAESTLARLPVPGRDFSRVALLSPQVVLSPGGALSITGQPDRLNSLQIDGATNNDLFGRSDLGGVGTPGQNFGARTLSVEAIKELQIISAPFDVRFGNFAAGLVNAVTKSGTNRFEGSVSTYYSERGLVGKDSEGERGTDFNYKELGITLGGPIMRDRAAFFLDAGIQRRIFPETAPLMGTDTTAGADSVDVGVRYNSAVRLHDILQRVYGVDAGNPGAFPFRVPAENLFGKLTFQLGVNSRLELSHNYSHSFPRLVFDRGFDFYPLTSSVFALPATTHATRLSWTAGFGNGYSNELVAARLHEANRCLPASEFPMIDVHADNRGLTAGSVCIPAIIRNDHEQSQTALELTDNLTLAAGAHRVTVGTHNELINLSSLQLLDIFFAAHWTFDSLDSLEQGLPSGYTATLRNPARPAGPLSNPRITQLGGYVQDQWSPNTRLTVTAGLRMDVPYVSRQPVGNEALFHELAIDNTRTPSGNMLWSPRLGFNYDLRGDGTTFVRGGVGFFAGRPAYKWFAAVDAHTGLEALQLSCTGDSVPQFVIDPARQPSTCAGGILPSTPLVNVFDPAFRFPRNLKVSAGVDHRLPGGVVGTLDLLYTRAINQYDLTDLNLETPSSVALGEGNRLMYGTVDTAGVATPHRRSQAFGPVMEVRNARGNRAYSITLQLQKRFASGTELSGSYTYSRSEDRLSASQDNTDGDVDFTPIDGSLEQRRITPSNWEVPHRLTLLATANVPLGIRFSLFYEGVSGGPFSYLVRGDGGASGDVNADGFFDDDLVYLPRDPRPGGDLSLVLRDDAGQLVPAPASEYQRFDRFIESQRCLRHQRGRLMRRNSCRNPWANNTGVRLGKTVPTFRGRSIELTVDIFNFLHLIDSDWGTLRGVDDTGLLEMVGYQPQQGRGVYLLHVPSLRAVDVDGSRWRLQLGATYRF